MNAVPFSEPLTSIFATMASWLEALGPGALYLDVGLPGSPDCAPPGI